MKNLNRHIPRIPPPNPGRMMKHWRVLCEEIGERRAGSKNEKRTADYLQKQFLELGLSSVAAEEFPCITVEKSEVLLKVKTPKGFRKIPGRALVGAPSTFGTKEISTEMVWVEMPEQASRLFQKNLRGKIVVLFGPLPNDVGLHRKLVSLAPAAVIHVDDRLPFDWQKDDGVYPEWTRRYGMPPMISIPYRVAWDLKKLGCNEAKIRVRVQQREGISQNVVAEIPGSNPKLPLIQVSAHHDTQCNTVGADDNASGVIGLLELAALLKNSRPLRTIRFISFGTEEQLSVGAAHYVKTHRKDLSRICAVLNLDGISSVLGHNYLFRGGQPEFGSTLVRLLAENGLDVKETNILSPYGDHFPFSVYGIPSMTLSRPNLHFFMSWKHHSLHDTLDEVSVEAAAKIIRALAGVISSLAAREKWPFARGLPRDQAVETRKLARDLFGMNV